MIKYSPVTFYLYIQPTPTAHAGGVFKNCGDIEVPARAGLPKPISPLQPTATGLDADSRKVGFQTQRLSTNTTRG